MASDWAPVILDEVAAVRNGAGIKAKFFADAGVPLARVSDFTTDSIDLSGCNFVEEEHAQDWRSHLLAPGDVVVATVGSWPPNWSSVVGKVVRVPESASGSIQNQNTACLRSKNDAIALRYLFYRLRSPDFLHHVAHAAGGSANQARIAIRNLVKFRFDLPPLDEQRRIAAVLGALDDKIELNRKMNRTLEEMAQAIFKSWFIDFDGVPDAEMVESELGPIPRGWEVKQIGKVVTVVGGSTPSTKQPAFWEGGTHCWTTPKDLSSVTSPVLLDTERRITDAGLAKVSSGLLPANTFLLSSRAPVGYTAIARVPLAVNQGYIAIPPGGRLTSLYLLHWARANLDIIKSRSGGTTFQEISKKNFRPIPVVVPGAARLGKFEEVVGALFAKIENSEVQSRTLTALRDALLPKLISGEIRVPEAEQAVEAVL